MLVPSTTYFHSTSFYIYVYQDCERNTVEKFRRLTQPLSLMRLLVKDTETRRRILARDMVPVQSDSVCYSIYITTLIYKLTLPYRRKLVSLTKYQYVPARQSFFFYFSPFTLPPSNSFSTFARSQAVPTQRVHDLQYVYKHLALFCKAVSFECICTCLYLRRAFLSPELCRCSS